MVLLRRILLSILAFVLVVVILFVVFVGPWPTYASSDYRSKSYYSNAIADISQEVAASSKTPEPERLQAGWSKREITPRIGVPLAGYGGRPGNKASTGVRDKLFVKAVAISDGPDTVVLVGADMLITPPNIAQLVRTQVAEKTPLTPSDIVFNASHTHCGPGGFGPGIAANVTGGPYDPSIPLFLAKAYADAIVEAYDRIEPAKLASGSVDAPEYIRNRVRSEAPIDPELSFAVLEHEDGMSCIVANYGAHPTIFSDDMMEFSAEYPGAMMAAIERERPSSAVFLSGAVGSMGPRAPEGPDRSARVDAMGEALAALVLAELDGLEYSDAVDIVSVGVPLGMPPFQLRPFPNNTGWRVSPFLPWLAGLPAEGWIHGVRIGDLLLFGMPCDFSGEISIEWKAWAEVRGYDLWTMSFCSAYCGYFSPDKYYNETPLGYETGLMSWFGPDIEAYFTDLFEHAVAEMAPVEAAASPEAEVETPTETLSGAA